MKLLVAIPVYNEENYVEKVLDEVRKYSSNIVVVNDGSTDRTGKLLARQRGLTVLTHQKNRGYGAALITVFSYALNTDSDIIITMDCDGQHEPARIPVLYEAIHDANIVSGSRYLRDFHQDSLATPADRLEINRSITGELNARLGLNLTDAFCGFKAYRRSALLQLHPTVASWGMPLQVWVQAACHGLRVKEVAVPAHLPRSEASFWRRAGRSRRASGLLSPGHRRGPGRGMLLLCLAQRLVLLLMMLTR